MTTLEKQLRSLRAAVAGLGLFILPIPLLLRALFELWTGDAGGFFAAAGGWALFTSAAVVIRRMRQERIAGEGRLIPARRVRVLKWGGGALLALATAVTALFAAGYGLAGALVLSMVATLGYVLLYGQEDASALPSLRVGTGADAEDAVRLLNDAYARLDSLEQAQRRIGSGEFRQRLGNIVTGANRVLTLVAEDPRDLRRARKFMTVYLDGAQRVADQYVRTHPEMRSAELEQNFRTLLVDLENTCQEQYETLLRNDAIDLDVQIEVLSARLRREGVV